MEPSSRLPKKILRSVITAKGSEYVYLPDGRTQRFKKATNELSEPQDLLVYIPSFDIIKIKALRMYPKIFAGIENEHQYGGLLLQYAQLQGKTVRPVDDKGVEILTNTQARSAAKVFLYFMDKSDPSNSFFLPVSIEPKLGYNSFDTRKYLNEQGETLRERHIGNKVVKINFEEQPESLKNNQVSKGMH